ncbi:MAG: FAD-binding protein, partial [Alphaproteobacteria bacterium]|nr:FAD-binding protein [Alphaproteobacteria bacterium]
NGEHDDPGVKMAWILLDRDGRRYMNEYLPYTHDTGHRQMQLYDTVRQDYPRIPSAMICDDNGRRLYPLGHPTSNDENVRLDWSEDNLAEVESGVLKRADTLAELAAGLGLDTAAVEASVARWNEACAAGRDEDFGRPPGTMVPVDTPPYYGAPIWPVVSNTQGGPVHDTRQRIVNVFGTPIPRLYAAGELGSAFGHLYLSGGNIAECFVSGRIAGAGAAALTDWG